jgi:DNA polymerase-1
MKQQTWLLLDVNNLAFRTLYKMPKLTYGNVATSIVYGILRDVLGLQERFRTNRLAFCFDCGLPIRYDSHKGYKQARRDKDHEGTQEDRQVRIDLYDQLNMMRLHYLRQIGYRNIFWQERYEADDVIASIVYDTYPHKFVIVSSDKDLYQLLSKRTSIWHPTKGERVTSTDFYNRYGISPSLWSYVKAIAGCITDSIPGVYGVGDKTAIKYIRGELPKSSDKYRSIKEFLKNGNANRNIELTELPYVGTHWFNLRDDEVTTERWTQFCKSVGIKTLPRTGGGK